MGIIKREGQEARVEQELVSGYLHSRAGVAIALIEKTLRNMITDVFRRNVPTGWNPDDWWDSPLVNPDTRDLINNSKNKIERSNGECLHPLEYATLGNLQYLIGDNYNREIFNSELGAPQRVHNLLAYIAMLNNAYRGNVVAHIRTPPTLLDVKRTLQTAMEILLLMPSKYHDTSLLKDHQHTTEAIILYWYIACQAERAESDHIAKENVSISQTADRFKAGFWEGTSYLGTVNEEDRSRIVKAIARILRRDPSQLITRENLSKMLDYAPTFIDGAFDEDERELRLFHNSIQCYEKLFPDPRDRSTEEDIRQWLRESYEAEQAEQTDNSLREIYAVLHADEDVFGVAYLSVYLGSPWAWVNYLGILKGWRTLGRTDKFIKDIDKYLQTTFPTVKGVVFEIDPIEFEFLKYLGVNSATLERDDFDESVLSNLRAVKRLEFFQFYRSSVILGQDGLPLPFLQPAMKEPLSAANEKELFLMVRPIEENGIKDIVLQEALDFVYDQIYFDAYDREGGQVRIPRYRPYVAEVKQRVEAKAKGGWSIKPLEIPKEIGQLFLRARILGLEDQLDL
jgi:hypothetical protein